MIRSFAHKGLAKFFHHGSTAGIQAKHAARLRLILDMLDYAAVIGDLDLPGMNLHPLKGDKKGLWAVKVNGNWRITFRFTDGDAEIVDYLDYH
jgi:proteic killer suppression protein